MQIKYLVLFYFCILYSFFMAVKPQEHLEERVRKIQLRYKEKFNFVMKEEHWIAIKLD